MMRLNSPLLCRRVRVRVQELLHAMGLYALIVLLDHQIDARRFGCAPQGTQADKSR
jgi:hypothetical protein